MTEFQIGLIVLGVALVVGVIMAVIAINSNKNND